MNSFDHLKSEEEREIRNLRIEKNPELEEIISVYEEVGKPHVINRPFDGSYYHFCDCAPVVKASSITEYTLTITDKEIRNREESYKIGLYLSALINKSPDEEHLIITEHLMSEIHIIGYKNTKKLKVNGNTGDWTGRFMSEGFLLVNGNTGASPGDRMSGGLLRIEGDAGQQPGENISGEGVLEIKGGWFTYGYVSAKCEKDAQTGYWRFTALDS